MLTLYLSLIDNEPDKALFERLYHTYRQIMYHAAYAILKNPDDAEDALQEVFLSLTKNLHNVHEDERLKTEHYLIVIVKNAAKRIYNKRRKNTSVPLDDIIPVIPADSNAEDEVERDGERQILLRVLARLQGDYREVLTLKYVQELPVKEIARTMGLSSNAVYKKLERAERALKQDISDEQKRQKEAARGKGDGTTKGRAEKEGTAKPGVTTKTHLQRKIIQNQPARRRALTLREE